MNHRTAPPSRQEDAATSASAGALRAGERGCPACRKRFDDFELYGVPPRRGRCPVCAAKPRHRALLWFFRRYVAPRLAGGGSVLEVGPGKFQTRYLTAPDYLGEARYVAIDIRHLKHHGRLTTPHQFVHASALAMPFADASFDVIVCNNTLPFIEQDRQAMAEMARCLRPDGVAMLQSHMAAGQTSTAADHAARHPELRPEWYAENAHFWVYGPDYPARIEAAGFGMTRTVHLLSDRSPAFRARFGLKPAERIVLGFSCEAGVHRFGSPAPIPAAPSAGSGWLDEFWS
ncbi:MAG: methyltransferase domain-containing protein [Pseudomonadota bacterium]